MGLGLNQLQPCRFIIFWRGSDGCKQRKIITEIGDRTRDLQLFSLMLSQLCCSLFNSFKIYYLIRLSNFFISFFLFKICLFILNLKFFYSFIFIFFVILLDFVTSLDATIRGTLTEAGKVMAVTKRLYQGQRTPRHISRI